MKRSEMIRFMSDTWYNWTKSIEPGTAGLDKACEHLLINIEEAGMLPPYHDTKDSEAITFGSEEVRNMVEKNSYLWEPEDEA